jgi:hypothetical protein
MGLSEMLKPTQNLINVSKFQKAEYMNFSKLIQGVLAGALFSGGVSAMFACYVSVTSNTVSNFGFTAKDFWWLALLIGGFFGVIGGGVIGGFVAGFNLNILKGGLCGLIVAIPVCGFVLLSDGKFDENISRFGLAYIFIASITGIFVSLTLMLLPTK